MGSAQAVYGLEWIAYCEVDALCFLKLRYVEESRNASLVGCVYGESPVKAQHEEVEVVT